MSGDSDLEEFVSDSFLQAQVAAALANQGKSVPP